MAAPLELLPLDFATEDEWKTQKIDQEKKLKEKGKELFDKQNEDFKQKEADLKTSLDTFDANWKEKFDKFNEDQTNALNAFKEKQKADFESEKQKIQEKVEHKKREQVMSAEYLRLKKSAKILEDQKCFDESRVLVKAANELVKAEQAALDASRKARQLHLENELTRKQSNALASFEGKQASARSHLEAKHSAERQRMCAEVANQKQKLKEAHQVKKVTYKKEIVATVHSRHGLSRSPFIGSDDQVQNWAREA